MQPKNANHQVFKTEDVVALYLGKVFDRKQMPRIRAIVEFLIGGGESFFYADIDAHNKVRQTLFKQYKWLGSIRYNREHFSDWITNVIHNHGEEIDLGSAK